MERESLSYLPLRTLGVSLFRGTLDSPAARDFVLLLELLSEESPNPAAVADTFGRLWEELAVDSGDLLPDAWQSYLVGAHPGRRESFQPGRREKRFGYPRWSSRRVGTSEPFRNCSRSRPNPCSTWWRRPCRGSRSGSPGRNPDLETENSHRGALARKLAAADDWGAGAELLADFYARHGAGAFNRCRAFRWKAGGLHPVKEPDPGRVDATRRLRERTEAAAREHGAFSGRTAGAPRAALRLAGDREVFDRQGCSQRVRGGGAAAGRGGEGRPRRVAAGVR